MDSTEVRNCTGSVCRQTNDVVIRADPSDDDGRNTSLLISLVASACGVLIFVVIILVCLQWGRVKLLKTLRKKKSPYPPQREMIDFTVPDIRVTQVYVTKRDEKKLQRDATDEKISITQSVSKKTSKHLLNGEDRLSEKSVSAASVNDEDRGCVPSDLNRRKLSKSHGDLTSRSNTLHPRVWEVTAVSDDSCRRYTMERFDIRPNELNTSEYTQSETALDCFQQRSSCEHGKICFSVAYNEQTEVLTVVIRKVVNLSARPTRVHADPYVKLTLLPEKAIKYVTNVHQRTLDPVFCQTFLFPVKNDELDLKTLKMTVCDHLKFFRRNVLGGATFPLKELGRPTMYRTHHEIWRSLTEDVPFKSVSTSQGEILLGIKLDQNLHQFILTVLQVRDLLLSEEEKERGGVIVKSTIMVGQQVIASKATKQTKYANRCSLFNKDIKVRVPQDCVNKLNVSVSVFVKRTFSNSRLVGRTNLGPYSFSEGSGLRQWINMLSSPTQLNNMWHKLK